MRKYVILTDSSCDLDRNKRKELDVEYVQMIIKKNDQERYVDLDWQSFTPKQFYDELRVGVIYKTTQITVPMYIDAYKKYLDQGYDILSITCSSALSGSINSSIVARDAVLEEYSDAKIICIDSLRGSMALGLIVDYAARMRLNGKSIDEVAAWVEDNKLNFNQVGTVADLVYLKRAGRVTGAAAFFSGVFKIKPVIIANAKGENQSIKKLRGRRASLKAILEYTNEKIIDPSSQTVFVSHADCLEDADYIKKYLIETIKCQDVYINYVGPIIGATVGPGMIGIYFYGQKVTAVNQ